MATSTDRLIAELAAHAEAVRPLASPLLRTLRWLLVAIALIALIVSAYGLRPDLLTALAVPATGLEWLGSLVTGALAAFAAFQVSVPGRSARWAWLPLPAVLLWLAGVGSGCLGEWLQSGASAFSYQSGSWHCSREILLISLPLGLVMLIMVRHAGAVSPAPTALLGALSAAALSSAGVALFHPGETALMALLWHVGTVGLLSLLCWLLSRRLFAWVGG